MVSGLYKLKIVGLDLTPDLSPCGGWPFSHAQVVSTLYYTFNSYSYFGSCPSDKDLHILLWFIEPT